MAGTNSTKSLKRTFLSLFFASGVAGLGYQVVWAKAFSATIGHEYPAVLAVVTAFMAGMAIGSAALIRERRLDRRLYGWLELLIGAWALATLALIPLAEEMIPAVLGLNPSPIFHWSVVFISVLLILLPATAAMGATLPAAERFLSIELRGDTTALLYGANTAGATVGVLAAAFWLMPMFGIRISIMVLASINLLCGFVALKLAQHSRPQAEILPRDLKPARHAAAIRLFLAGLFGIAFELAMVRALSHVLENTVFTFAVVIATFLIGTAIGAFVFYRAKSHWFLEADFLFAYLAVACALVAIGVKWSPAIYEGLRSTLGDSMFAVAVSETLTSATFLLVPTFFMGALWSALAQQTLSYETSLAWSVVVNTAGAAVAPALLGLVAIPVLGLQGALLIIPMGYALLAWRKRLTPILVLMILAVIPVSTSVRDLIRTNGDKMIHLREGVMGTVSVLENSAGARSLKFNNRFQMGGTAARVAEERQAAIPLLLHPDPDSALFIGLGTGITFHAARHYPELQADGVELVPEIADAMAFFNPPARTSSTLRLFVDDGRRYVRTADRRYDVIVGDLFHPAQDGAAFLYTREHFSAIRDRLAEGGLFCQWLPVYQMDPTTLRTVMNTFVSVFPHAELWLLRFNIDLPVVGLIGRTAPARYHPGLVESKMTESLQEHLKALGLGDSLRLFGCYVGPLNFRGDVPLNTDWNPTLLFRAPAITFKRNDNPSERLFALLAEVERSPATLFASANTEFTTGLTQFIDARDTYLSGLQHEMSGDLARALESYINSARISRHFTAGYAQALTIASSVAKTNPVERERILKALVAAQPAIPVAGQLLEATK
ncbi:MAG TPA: fused MFS/spermidine synthase [Verrucomicrobiae bacterium]